MHNQIELKAHKISGKCYMCKQYKMRATMYKYYSHPALISITGNEHIGDICKKCAIRESNKKKVDRLDEKK